MIHHSYKNTLIYNEFDEKNNIYWFDFKRQKFLHNIDTYYYSVRFTADEESKDNFYEVLREDKERCKKEGETLSSISSKYITNGYSFGSYKYDLEIPDEYLILIAEHVPNEQTPQIIVQIRSMPLWLYGVFDSIKKSFECVQDICMQFNLSIKEVKSNRIDYCWHTNYIQDLDTFFNPVNIAKMRVSRFDTADMHFKFRGEEDIEYDYIRLGRLKSNNMIFRAYLKSKEVVEMGYKPWFLKIWQLNGLINRYDLYVYEECFKNHSWEYLHKARLKFYYEYGQDQNKKNIIGAILNEQNGTGISNYDDLKSFADELTPKVNFIINFEYQTMRKFYSSIEFVNFRDRQGICKDLLLELDSRRLVLDYLTHETLRFVGKNGDTNKARRDYAPFWERLRKSKIIDCIVPPESLSLVRVYKTNLCADLVKRKAINNIATLNVYKQNDNVNIYSDIVDFVSSLNDNDLYQMKQYKNKKIQLLKNTLEEATESKTKFNTLGIVDLNTGLLLNQ